MAGHSHWAGIKHKKAVNDAKKGKVFSKLAKLLYTAVKEGGGGDPNDNPRLRLVIEKCRQANMPKDNIKRAIDKAMSTAEGYEQMTFEGYAAAGVSFVVEAMTDNTNRTGPEIRHIIEKAGAKMGKQGCAVHMFQRKGVFQVDQAKASEEKLMEVTLEAGAEDIVDQGDFFEVLTDPTDFVTVGEALEKAGIETGESEVRLIPDNVIEVGEEDGRKIMKLIEKLEEHEDVNNVYANFDLTAEAAEVLAAED